MLCGRQNLCLIWWELNCMFTSVFTIGRCGIRDNVHAAIPLVFTKNTYQTWLLRLILINWWLQGIWKSFINYGWLPIIKIFSKINSILISSSVRVYIQMTSASGLVCIVAVCILSSFIWCFQSVLGTFWAYKYITI